MALWKFNGDNAYRTLDLFLLRGVQTKLRYFASILKLAVARRIVTCTCQCVRLLIAPTILPLSTDCIRSRHARHAGVPSIKDQLGIWERDQLWVWSHRKFWKKRDGASWFWEILFPFAGAPAKCRRNGQFRHILTAIRVGQTAKVLKIRSSFGPVCGIYNGAQMGNDRQTEPELKRRGHTRVRDRCINASVTCDPRQN